MKSQNDAILEHLKTKGPITPLQALELYGCFRLSSRIFDIRKDLAKSGMNIKKKMVSNGRKEFASYSIEYLQEPNGQYALNT